MPNSLGITTNPTRKPGGKADNRTDADRRASNEGFAAEMARRNAEARKKAERAEQRRRARQ